MVTYINEARYEALKTLNDFKYISIQKPKPLTVDDYNNMHFEAIEFLKCTIEQSELPIIVLTHHAPLTKGTSNPCYEAIQNRPLNTCFATDLRKYFNEKIRLWAFGHTHWPCSFYFDTTHVYSNPRGTYRGVNGYVSSGVVTVTSGPEHLKLDM